MHTHNAFLASYSSKPELALASCPLDFLFLDCVFNQCILCIFEAHTCDTCHNHFCVIVKSLILSYLPYFYLQSHIHNELFHTYPHWKMTSQVPTDNNHFSSKYISNCVEYQVTKFILVPFPAHMQLMFWSPRKTFRCVSLPFILLTSMIIHKLC